MTLVQDNGSIAPPLLKKWPPFLLKSGDFSFDLRLRFAVPGYYERDTVQKCVDPSVCGMGNRPQNSTHWNNLSHDSVLMRETKGALGVYALFVHKASETKAPGAKHRWPTQYHARDKKRGGTECRGGPGHPCIPHAVATVLSPGDATSPTTRAPAGGVSACLRCRGPGPRPSRREGRPPRPRTGS